MSSPPSILCRPEANPTSFPRHGANPVSYLPSPGSLFSPVVGKTRCLSWSESVLFPPLYWANQGQTFPSLSWTIPNSCPYVSSKYVNLNPHSISTTSFPPRRVNVCTFLPPHHNQPLPHHVSAWRLASLPRIISFPSTSLYDVSPPSPHITLPRHAPSWRLLSTRHNPIPATPHHDVSPPSPDHNPLPNLALHYVNLSHPAPPRFYKTTRLSSPVYTLTRPIFDRPNGSAYARLP